MQYTYHLDLFDLVSKTIDFAGILLNRNNVLLIMHFSHILDFFMTNSLRSFN